MLLPHTNPRFEHVGTIKLAILDKSGLDWEAGHGCRKRILPAISVSKPTRPLAGNFPDGGKTRPDFWDRL